MMNRPFLPKAILFAAIGCVFLLTSCSHPDFSSDETGRVDGEKIYTYYCTSCHGPTGDRGAGKAANLIESRMEDRDIRHIILFGAPNGMAAYQSMIKEEEELNALVDYVKTLRR
jgi:mono/diheme cytochrome c family protein